MKDKIDEGRVVVDIDIAIRKLRRMAEEMLQALNELERPDREEVDYSAEGLTDGYD